ncbi:MAG TPA: dienelactone hydrolase family protein [Thermoanaerobaculia bacterium]|nr:dienelactone hydrolase family protein [Thermoanaerobaculia bacterium]
MRKLTSLITMLLLFACANHPSATDQHVHGTTPVAVKATPATLPARRGTSVAISSPVAGETGYLSVPAGSGKHPAIIVIQEWWGVTDWIKGNADRFADAGYVALAPDLYRGKSTEDPAVAHELMRGLPEDRAVGDIKGAFALLAARPDVDKKRIGVIGWCMGGGYSLALATVEPRLAACVINYGRLVTDPATIARIRSPMLGNFGATDRGITPQDVAQFEAALKTAGKEQDIKEYPGAGHGFMNPGNKDGYNPAASSDAWKRIDGFLGRKLKR